MFICGNCGIEMDESIFGPTCPHPPIRGSEFTKTAAEYAAASSDPTTPIDAAVVDVHTLQAIAEAAIQPVIPEEV